MLATLLRSIRQRLFNVPPESKIDSTTHIDALRDSFSEHQRRFPLDDMFPPTFLASDGVPATQLITPTISYYVTNDVFIKRQPHPTELGFDIHGNPVTNPYIADRLRNEAAVLKYIRKNTTIPVPKVIDLHTMNGLVYLKTSFVKRGVELDKLPESDLPFAIDAVSKQLESDILPQLRSLRSDRIGSPDATLPVIPPKRFWQWKEDRRWPSVAGRYTFCHIDLDRRNILVDPKTYKIVAIIDWETAGFFPSEWELPFWKQNADEKFNLIQLAKDREKGFFPG